MRSQSDQEIDNLSIFLIEEFGGTDRNESACEMAIRVISDYKKRIEEVAMMKERGC